MNQYFINSNMPEALVRKSINFVIEQLFQNQNLCRPTEIFEPKPSIHFIDFLCFEKSVIRMVKDSYTDTNHRRILCIDGHVDKSILNLFDEVVIVS